MSTSPPTPPQMTPLSLFVLLPASAHSSQPAAVSNARPSPLVSRQSGSRIPSLRSLGIDPSTTLEDTPEIDKVVNAGRRLSLAPGMGAGTHSRGVSPRASGFSPASVPEEPSEDSGPAPPASKAPAFGSKPAFGSGSPIAGRGRRRPQTSNAAQLLPNQGLGIGPRGSMAGTSRAGLIGGGMMGKTRPGWEGDEVVGMLRGSGLEVSIIRHAAQLPTILSFDPLSPSFSSFNQQAITARPSSSTVVTPLVLVPLSDSPTIPSLSLLLQQGTTPTAVCFQQDLLDRAKRSEEEWLPAALQQIRTIVEMRDRSAPKSLDDPASPTIERHIVLAYSANPALSSGTIAACVNAGASGVLKPPYSLDTARIVRRMVRAAKEGRISSVVGLPTHDSRSQSPALDDDGRKVILPPTALSMGGEHEAEKVLSGAYKTHRRGTSASFETWSPSAGRSRESSTPARKMSLGQTGALATTSEIEGPVSAMTQGFPEHPDDEIDLRFASLLVYDPLNEQKRRRSVDTSGLGIALHRAQRAFETVKLGRKSSKIDFPISAKDDVASIGSSDSTHDEDSCADTHLAELLSAMYYQTQVAISVEMSEYERFSVPLSRDARNRLVDALATWDFKPHYLADDELFQVACLLFDGLLHSEGLAELGLERDQVNRLLYAIRAIYHAPNPYHNYVHAIDVVQATYSFLISIGLAPPWSYIREMTPRSEPWKRPTDDPTDSQSPGSRRARQVFRPQDVFAILVAAMGHDVGHPGLSNAFMKNARTPLSQVYDDKSVLENMHCMLIVQLLRKHGFGFLLGNTSSGAESIPARASFDSKGFRHVLYQCVLATDMSLHFVWMQKLQDFGEYISRQKGVYSSSSVLPGMADDEGAIADRIVIAQALIKCADISNPTRPIDVSEHWSTVLLKEWAVQASLETDLELPVSVIASADAALQAKGQIGFIKLFTQPLFDAVSDVLPELQCYADWCAANHDIWESRSEKLRESESAAEIVQPAVEDASYDERFSTLFPLSLPFSLVEAHSLEPGPVKGYVTDALDVSALPSNTPQQPTTPLTPRKSKWPSHTKLAESPSAKAMRAVYHATLLDQRHGLYSRIRGVPIPGVQPDATYLNARRRSSPGGLNRGDWGAC